MDYVDAFRPLFAYATHLAASAESPDAPPIDAQAAANDLALLLNETERFRNKPIDPNFDQARFALSAWLDATLRKLPNGDEIATRLMPADESRERDFFRRLDLLLMPLPGGYPKEIRSILKVYRTCLDLGDKAFQDNPDAIPNIDRYRERCRKATAPNSPPIKKQTAARPTHSFGGAAATAVLWVAAAAVPLALYGLYKFLLGGLYAAVVG